MSPHSADLGGEVARRTFINKPPTGGGGGGSRDDALAEFGRRVQARMVEKGKK